MDFLCYILLCAFIAHSSHSLPVLDDSEKNYHYLSYPDRARGLVGPLDGIVAHESKGVKKREIVPDIGEMNYFNGVVDENEDDDGDLEVSEAKRYNPYFRFRRIYRIRYNQPRYPPLSNYADSSASDDDDRFPTTF